MVVPNFAVRESTIHNIDSSKDIISGRILFLMWFSVHERLMMSLGPSYLPAHHFGKL